MFPMTKTFKPIVSNMTFNGFIEIIARNIGRLKLFTYYNNIVPFSIGIHGGVDYGRVWQPGEASDKWHVGYGGGIWITPVDFIILSLGYYTSDDDTRIQFTVGHQF
ncbi:MAG: hypothetical protein ACI85O_003390 [Saprospiraceae bacterium]|jgi:hypothetical protein